MKNSRLILLKFSTLLQNTDPEYKYWTTSPTTCSFTALCIFGLHFLPSCRCPAERWRQGCPLPASSAVKRPPHGAQWSTAADDWSPAKHNNTLKLNAATNKHTAGNWSAKHNSTSNWMQQKNNNTKTQSWQLVSYKTQWYITLNAAK